LKLLQVFQKSFIHPLLFALFPIIFIFSYNESFLSYPENQVYNALLFPSIIFFTITAISWAILKFSFKNSHKSSIALSVSIILFFSYGHIHNSLLDSGLVLYGNKILLPIFLIILVITIIALIRTKYNFSNFTKIINGIALTMILLSLINIVNLESYTIDFALESEKNLFSKFDPPPNVYYIIPDAYTGFKALKHYWEYDNSEFYNELEKRNFTIIHDSKSNYANTILSLPSVLNMKYHDNFGKNEDFDNTRTAFGMINDNHVMKNFKNLGYDIVTISSDWSGTRNFEIADQTFCGTFSKIDDSQILISILDNSALKPFYVKFFVDDQREKILCQFDAIRKITNANNDPKFVFVHTLIPHGPYLFGPDGEKLNPKSLELGYSPTSRDFDYLKQLQFTNKKLLELVDNILINSETPPIIIIQSDHGWCWYCDPFQVNPSHLTIEDEINEQMYNLSTYHLPYGGESILHDEVSPVNTFRLIFNFYFNAEYEILDDKFYYISGNPFVEDGYPKFIDVTDKLKP